MNCWLCRYVSDSVIGVPSWTAYPVHVHVGAKAGGEGDAETEAGSGGGGGGGGDGGDGGSLGKLPFGEKPFQHLGKPTAVLNACTLGLSLGQPPAENGSFSGRAGTAARPPVLVGGEGASDGFKVDAEGLIWSTIPNGIAVIDPVRAEVKAQVIFGTNTSNVAFGAGGDVWVTGLGFLWRVHRAHY